MPRVKRGTTHLKKRRSILKKAKGFKWGRKNKIKAASTAINKAGVNAYVGRKLKKRTNRRLWQIKLNAAVREHGLSYSKFIDKLKKANIDMDRKVLADIAENNPKVFKQIVDQINK